MALGSTAVRLPLSQAPARLLEHAPLRGLLITSDCALARAFRRELQRGGRIVPLEVYPTLEHASDNADVTYAWVSVDLDGAVAPSDAVRVARRSWPGAIIAVLSYWWSDREQIARNQADHVIHKPIRAPELDAFFQSLSGRQPVRDDRLQQGLRSVS